MKFFRPLLLVLLLSLCRPELAASNPNAVSDDNDKCAGTILFVGDSMTGWLAERLNAYGEANGFTVVAEIWDGSTIRKWGSDTYLAQAVARYKPDAVFVSLGLNELFETNPEKRLRKSMDSIKKAIGDVPVIWIGPLSWPGKNMGSNLNSWLADEMGEGHYFDSFDMSLPRQGKNNPHPTREATAKWMDAIVRWLQTDGAVKLPGYESPAREKMSRPKVFNYRRMKR